MHLTMSSPTYPGLGKSVDLQKLSNKFLTLETNLSYKPPTNLEITNDLVSNGYSCPDNLGRQSPNLGVTLIGALSTYNSD